MSLRSRLLVAFLTPTMALLTIAGLYGYQVSRNILERELGTSLSAVAATVAAQLPADRLLTLTYEDSQQEGSRTYRTLSKQLERARLASGARRIVAFKSTGEVLLDSGGALPIGSSFPDLARDRLELAPLFSTGSVTHSQVLFQGDDGQFYKTGYAPLTEEGKVVGAVAIEGNAAFFGPLKQLFQAYAATLMFTLVVLALVALLTARTLAGPLERLVQSALRIGGGDLETEVKRERTSEIGLLSRELEAMRLGLQSRDRQLKMMLAGVAHEVRNPLGGIALFTGLLAEETQGQPTHEHVQRIQKELDYLKRIVDDFLSFAREQRLNPSDFDAVEWLDSVAQLVSASASERKIQLQTSAEPLKLNGDASLLTAAVVNLIQNAIQISQPGQQVLLRGHVSNGQYRVEVEDQGPGISTEIQKQIFEPFFTTREKGTGLGLPLARKFFEAHSGTLTVTSQPGRTIFTGTLPLKS